MTKSDRVVVINDDRLDSAGSEICRQRQPSQTATGNDDGSLLDRSGPDRFRINRSEYRQRVARRRPLNGIDMPVHVSAVS